ncbi:MAG: hypothetical protein ABI759_18395 [Candidatus Solibacter sp.]
MKSKVLLTALLAILLAGCDLRGKGKNVVPPVAPKPAVVPVAPPPPPAPLSTPQTNVVLPKEQPLDEAALVTQPAPLPEPAPAAGPPARPRTNRTATPPAAPPPPVAVPTAPEPREAVQEIVPAADMKRLQERALARRGEASQILSRIGRLNGTQQGVAASIRNFLALSEQAEKYNDMRQADALAERAQILAKELQSGK